ncbi:rod shape-determining protein RodA [Patescibacteria group bacterium]|nr:rod shape-determining protein RodA [Patescibacteria group bacterium]MBU4162245.1 rod shape-determining protein RodA [Patescibacteria group bacterium]
MISHFKKFDYTLVLTAVILTGIGLLSLYSSSSGTADSFLNFNKQFIFLGIGLLLMTIISFIDYRGLKDNSYFILILYALGIIALIGLLVFNNPIRGVRSWYKIGQVAIAPVEFLKIVIIALLAKYFSSRHVEMYKFRHIILSGAYIAIPIFLIFIQPDVGSVLVLIFLWIGVLAVSGIRLRHFAILSLCGIILFLFAWGFLLKDYQKERIISFAVPEYEPLQVGWNQRQTKIAIGNGGLLGRGLGKGSQTQQGFLPEPQTDFIFSAIAEEFGFLSIIGIIFLFFVFFWRITNIALCADNNFSRLFALGVGFVVMAQFFINIGSNIGYLPVIGGPLPFVSYGGSFLISMFICLGVLQNIRINSTT